LTSLNAFTAGITQTTLLSTSNTLSVIQQVLVKIAKSIENFIQNLLKLHVVACTFSFENDFFCNAHCRHHISNILRRTRILDKPRDKFIFALIP
jgi:hypothetical protein